MNRLIKPHNSLRIFLCHSSGDKPAVRKLYKRLCEEGFEPWLDEENLLPGQNWEQEISKAVRNSDVIIVCLSSGSISKSGYVQKEIKFSLDIADEQPEGTIFLIPVKLEECDLPEQLKRWHSVNLLDDRGYERLVRALQHRASTLGRRLKRSRGIKHPPIDPLIKLSGSGAFHNLAIKKIRHINQSITSKVVKWILGCFLLLLISPLLIFLLNIPPVTPKSEGVNNSTLYPTPKLPVSVLNALTKQSPVIIRFRMGRYDLSPDDERNLAGVYEFLLRNPNLKILVAGHAEATGPEEYNLMLSRRRADNVARYLTELGIASDRISVEAYGEERPIYPGSSIEGRNINSRVEISVIND